MQFKKKIGNMVACPSNNLLFLILSLFGVPLNPKHGMWKKNPIFMNSPSKLLNLLS
jgi:hypothetical protein